MQLSFHPLRVIARHRARIAVGFALLFSLALFEGCGDENKVPRLNVILISLDTLRADRLGMYGYDRETSPALDAFAQRGVVFDQTVAESPWTLPSHVTMLSGTSPDRHGTTLPSLKPSPEVRYISEMLADEGYLTVGLTDGGYVGRRYEFDRGFTVFDDEPTGLDVALRTAREQIDNSGERPFFLFIHTYDIHCPYEPAPAMLARFATPGARAFDITGKCGNPHFNQMVFRPGYLEHVSNAYDAGIREADDLLGAFFADLEAEGHLEDTILIITSDHGEEFKEHGQIGHERSLYREVLLVPLIIVGPGVPVARGRTPAGLADIVPTLCDMLNLDFDTALDGRPLLIRSAEGGFDLRNEPDRILTSSLAWKVPLRSTMDATHHRIRNDRSGTEELYDMVADPLETMNLTGTTPDVAPHLRTALDVLHDGGSPIAPQAIGKVTPEQAERLRNLGYIQ